MGAAAETFNDVWGRADTEGARAPATVCVLDVSGVSRSRIGELGDDTWGVFDEDFPGQGECSLVALLGDAEIVHVFLCPSPLDTAVILGVFE